MKLYLDCEWNGGFATLISLALCAEDGREFYEVLPYDEHFLAPWVAKHVIPILEKRPVESLQEFQEKLSVFLNGFDTIHIVADWPEDISHFCQSLITRPGMRLTTPPLTMEVVRVDAPSKLPHNALHDARGIRDALTKTFPA